MPYIKKELREKVNQEIIELASKIIEISNKANDQNRSLPGIMNYSISQLIEYVYPVNDCGYKEFNEVIGFIESLKMEYYRKMVSPYEDIKERQNGPINTEGLYSAKNIKE